MRNLATITITFVAFSLATPASAQQRPAQAPQGKSFSQLIAEGYEVKTMDPPDGVIVVQKQTSVFICIASFQPKAVPRTC